MKKIIVMVLAVGCFVNSNAMLRKFKGLDTTGRREVQQTTKVGTTRKDLDRMYSVEGSKRSSGRQSQGSRQKFNKPETDVKLESKWNMPGSKGLLAALATGFAGLMALLYGTDEKWEDGKKNLNLFTTKFLLSKEGFFNNIERGYWKVNKDKTAYKILDIKDKDLFSLYIPTDSHIAIVSYQGDKDNPYNDNSNNLIIIPFSYEKKDKAIELMQKYYDSHDSTSGKGMYIISGANAQPLESEKDKSNVYQVVNLIKIPKDNEERHPADKSSVIQFNVVDGLLHYSY